MKNNVYTYFIGILMIIIIIETGYFIINNNTFLEQIKNIEREVKNRTQQRKIIIEDIITSSHLSKELNKNKTFINNVSDISKNYLGNVLFIFSPGNTCLDCISEHFKIITGIVEQEENLALVILCRPVDYRKNQLMALKPFMSVVSVNESIPIDSDRPFLFYLNINKIEGLFFINKNFEDYTKASVIALCNNFK